MSEELEVGAAVPEVNVDALLDTWQQFFAELDPPEYIEIKDEFGSKYKVRASVTARKQIRLLREVEKLSSLELPPGILAGDPGSFAKGLLTVFANEEALDMLASMFSVAHPEVLEGTLAKAKEQGITNEHPADLFSIDEMIGGLLPFFIQSAGKLISLVKPVLGSMNLQA